MKLELMSNDDELLHKLKDSSLFEQVTTVFNKEDLKAECIVLSDHYLDYKSLNELTFSDEQTVFYLLHNHYEVGVEKVIHTLCASLNVVLIPPRLTVEQIVEKIVNTFKKSVEDKNNVVSFLSPVSNIGTTTICLSVAKSLSEMTNAKIGVLSLNAWDHGTHQLIYKGKYLDEIKGKLHNQVINGEEEFLSLFHKEQDSLYILGGNRFSKLERLYTKEEIHYLINLSKKYFDLVLIDSGSHVDNANMVQSLYESDLRFLILNQQTKTVNVFNRLFDEILLPLGYKKHDFLGILNNFKEKSQYLNLKNISAELEVEIIFTIYEVQDSLLTEQENKLLYSFSDPLYKESISSIAKSITSYTGLKLLKDEAEKKKKRFFSFT